MQRHAPHVTALTIFDGALFPPGDGRVYEKWAGTPPAHFLMVNGTKIIDHAGTRRLAVILDFPLSFKKFYR
jgi:hypothetical protein